MSRVWLVAEMVHDEGTSYLLNEVVAVYADEALAEAEAKRLAEERGTYSVMEYEVRHGLALM